MKNNLLTSGYGIKYFPHGLNIVEHCKAVRSKLLENIHPGCHSLKQKSQSGRLYQAMLH